MNNTEIFPRDKLYKLIIPLFIEQILSITIGMADTVMVSSVGEAAVSGVSIVDSINVLLINIFSALATGGAVIISQYLGRYDHKNANIAAKQLLYISTLITLLITAFSLFFNNQILVFIFGKIDSDVMQNAVIYYYITVVSYPFLAIYNSGAAVFRSVGNSRISMFCSIIMNLINISGNAVLIYGYNLSAAGAAIATLLSRIVGAFIMLILLCRGVSGSENIRINKLFHPEPHIDMIKSIMKIGIPTGLENGMFQIGKLLVQGLITTFGTASIAANAISNSIAGVAVVPGSAIGLAMLTVVGQCIGAGDTDQAVKYTKKLMKYVYLMMGVLNLLVFIFNKQIASLFNLSAIATAETVNILAVYTPLCALIWPISFCLPNALRAAGDARFTMLTSVFSMWIFRIGFSYILASALGMKLMGVWIAMYIDWFVRSGIFTIRFIRGKWKKIKVI